MTAGPRAAANRGAGVKHDPHPCYRDSGVEWLDEVPEHWEVRPFRRVLRESLKYGANEAAELDDPSLPRFVRITDINEGGRLRDETFRSLPIDIAEPYLLESGDLLFARSGSVGRTFLYDESWGICAYAGYLIRARVDLAQVMPEFISYFSASQSYTSWLRTVATQATIENVNAERYSMMPVPLPPLDEQRAIAAYLDRETERIDALVAKKRLLIERLEEYRTALITRTVTRGLPVEAARAAGLDPSPRLKPSGVEWLGEVPEHWEVGALRHAVVLQRGHDLPADRREEGDVPIVSSGGVFGSHALAAAQGPGIVTGRYGSIGEFQLVDGPYWPLNTTLYTVDLRGNDVRFLRYMRMNLKSLFLVNSAKSAVPGVDRNDLHPVPTAVPPKAEQKAIAEYLDTETNKLSELVGRAEAAIERLLEYRTALITAAVTGKVDVRE